jgi:signal transduction histidine kinase
MGWELGGLWRFRKEGGGLDREATWASGPGSNVAPGPLELVSDPALPQAVAARGDALWVHNVEHDPMFATVDASFRSGFRSAIGVPMRSGDRTVGVITLFTRERRVADPASVALLQTLCGQIGEFTERRRAENEAERMKDEFFALVSHELRTPLTSIIGYLDLLAESGDDLSDRNRDSVAIMDRNARRLLRLVGDLLFAAQVEAGHFDLESAPVDLGAVVAQTIEAARPKAEEDGVRLSVSAQPVPTISGDFDRLSQALDNLVLNAIKFTPAGGRVTVRLSPQGDMACLEIEDDGIGIEGPDVDRLFERFFQADGSPQAAKAGAGLGLAIVKAIVTGHGGTIDVESEPGSGSTFRVMLPVQSPQGNGRARRTAEVVPS